MEDFVVLTKNRSFGDMESKIMKTGNKVNLVIAEPEIYKYSVKDMDFAVLASDGVYDKLSNEQIVETVWETIDFYKRKYKEEINRKIRLRGTSNSKNSVLRSSLNTYTSQKLTERVRRKSQRKTYSQVFDSQKSIKKGNRSKSKKNNVKSRSTVFGKSMNSKNEHNDSVTSIDMKQKVEKELEPWELKCRQNYEKILGDCVNNILKRSLLNESDDNVTLIMLVFKDLLQV